MSPLYSSARARLRFSYSTDPKDRVEPKPIIERYPAFSPPFTTFGIAASTAAGAARVEVLSLIAMVTKIVCQRELPGRSIGQTQRDLRSGRTSRPARQG